MGDISDKAAAAFRDFAIAGLPASGPNEPVKSEIRALFTALEERLGGAAAGLKFYATKAALDADATQAPGTLAYVYKDDTAANNVVYHYDVGGWVKDTTYYTGVASVVQPVVDAGVRDALLSTFPTSLQVGESPGTYTSFIGPNVVIGLGFHFLQRAVLIGGKVNTQVAGPIEIMRAARATDSNKHKRIGDPLTLNVPGGSFTFGWDDLYSDGVVPLIFEAGELAAFRAPAAVRFRGSNMPYFSWANGLGTDPVDTALNIEGAGAEFDFELYFRLEAPANPAGYVVLERVDSFSALPGGWRSDAATSISNGAITITSSGFVNQLSSGKPYGLDRRVISFDVQFAAANAHLQFQTNPAGPVDSGQYEGSMVVLEADTNRLSVYHRWDGGASVPPVDADDHVPLTNPDGTALSIVTNRTYTVEVEKVYRDYRVTLTDPAGPSFFTYLVDNDDLNTYTNTYGTHTKYGMMHGAPGITSAQGAVRLLNWRHTAKYRQFCAWYFNGDSLTEGYGVGEAERMGALFADEFGEDNVAISGVGGRDTRGGILSTFCELDALSPQNVLIYLGSNPGDGADYAGNMGRMVRLARNRGANVVIATVTGAADRAAAAAAIQGVTLTRFGSATTTAGPGSTPIDFYYVGIKPEDPAFKDGLHGNAQYHKRNLAQFLRDAGRLIEAARAR